MINRIVYVFILLVLVCFVYGDENFYRDSNSVNDNSESLNLVSAPTAQLDIYTSSAYLAGTTDHIMVYIIGEFSVSGPHSIGPFSQGGHDLISIQLDKRIGELKRLEFQKTGSDGWLLSRVTCTIGNSVYEMKGSRMWLDALSPYNEVNYHNGYEPNAQEGPEDLPASSKTWVDVVGKRLVYTSTGLLNPGTLNDYQ